MTQFQKDFNLLEIVIKVANRRKMNNEPADPSSQMQVVSELNCFAGFEWLVHRPAACGASVGNCQRNE